MPSLNEAIALLQADLSSDTVTQKNFALSGSRTYVFWTGDSGLMQAFAENIAADVLYGTIAQTEGGIYIQEKIATFTRDYGALLTADDAALIRTLEYNAWTAGSPNFAEAELRNYGDTLLFTQLN